MDIDSLLAVLVLVVTPVNFAHWFVHRLCNRPASFVAFPKTRWLKGVFLVCFVAINVSAALVLLVDLLPPRVVGLISFTLFVVWHAYSVVARHRQCRSSESVPS